MASQGTFSNIWRHFCITRVGGPLAYSGVLVSNASEHHTIHGSRHNKESSSQTATVPRPRSLATLLTHCMKCLVPVTRRSRINLRQNCDVVLCLLFSSFRVIVVTSSHRSPGTTVLHIFFHNNPKNGIFYPMTHFLRTLFLNSGDSYKVQSCKCFSIITSSSIYKTVRI